MPHPSEYDGLYFFPSNEGRDLNLAYFNFTEEEKSDNVETHQNGDVFHIGFFKHMNDGLPKFDESFEAILSDPSVYVNSLVGSDLYGCIVRKTDKSTSWFKSYIEEMRVLIDKMIN
jgi:hypothetical protein